MEFIRIENYDGKRGDIKGGDNIPLIAIKHEGVLYLFNEANLDEVKHTIDDVAYRVVRSNLAEQTAIAVPIKDKKTLESIARQHERDLEDHKASLPTEQGVKIKRDMKRG